MYKLADGGVLKDGEFIPVGHRKYAIYEAWVAGGGVPDPQFTVDQIREQKQLEIAEEGRRRIDAYGPPDARQQRRALVRGMKLVRKQAKGTLTPEESTELDNLELIGDNIEATEQLIEAEVEALDLITDRSELESYDPVNGPLWPI